MRSGLLRKIQPPLGQVTGDVVARMQDATSDAVEALVAADNVITLPLTSAVASQAIVAGQPVVVFNGVAGTKLTLPPAASNPGSASFQFIINASGNPVGVIPSGNDTVNGAKNLNVSAGAVAMLVSDGVSKWIGV